MMADLNWIGGRSSPQSKIRSNCRFLNRSASLSGRWKSSRSPWACSQLRAFSVHTATTKSYFRQRSCPSGSLSWQHSRRLYAHISRRREQRAPRSTVSMRRRWFSWHSYRILRRALSSSKSSEAATSTSTLGRAGTYRCLNAQKKAHAWGIMNNEEGRCWMYHFFRYLRADPSKRCGTALRLSQ